MRDDHRLADPGDLQPDRDFLDARDLSAPENGLRFRLRHAVPGLDPGIDSCIQGRRSRIINNGAA
jgi:hypothetical protein